MIAMIRLNAITLLDIPGVTENIKARFETFHQYQRTRFSILQCPK
jgi:hypothetical protein